MMLSTELETELETELALELVAKVEPERFPARTLLRFYYICEDKDSTTNLYINYYENFKLLRDWLAPFSYEPSKTFTQELHSVLMNYEIQQLSVMLDCYPEFVFHTFLDFYMEEEGIYGKG